MSVQSVKRMSWKKKKIMANTSDHSRILGSLGSVSFFPSLVLSVFFFFSPTTVFFLFSNVTFHVLSFSLFLISVIREQRHTKHCNWCTYRTSLILHHLFHFYSIPYHRSLNTLKFVEGGFFCLWILSTLPLLVHNSCLRFHELSR